MKSLIVILVFFLTITFAFAQHIEISEAARAKDNGTFNSYLFELPDVSKKEAESDWKDFIKAFKSKAKYNRKSNIWTAENAKMPRLSETTLNVYTKIIEDSNPNKKTSVIVWFNVGDGYINAKADNVKSAYAHEILTEYALTTSKHHAQEIVKDEENQLKKMEKDLEKLKKDNTNYYKNIDKAKEDISKNEKNIEVNELDQRNKEKEIEAQRSSLGMAKENVKKFN